MPKTYSCRAFEESRDPTALGAELAGLLLPRLRAAPDPMAEAHAIVEDLRHCGHEVWSSDEASYFSTWGDDYVTPPRPTRFLIHMIWPSEDEPGQDFEVQIIFGAWPRDGK
jgi:hypothetical protein